jgi:DNA primase
LGRIPDEVIAEVRDRADIVAVIGEHVALKKVGASFKGLCPFHGEKTPSFNVSPAKRSYYCFGCQRSGDVFKFVSELQGKSFVEVVRELAARSGVVIPEKPESASEQHARSERTRLLDVNATAAAFYRAQLQDPELGKKGRAYLESRGIGEAIAETFRLGLAPEGWDALSRHLEQRKVPVELALTLGLVTPRKTAAGYYDKFRDRLLCPVLLPAGEVVGFSGRTLGSDPETPKYVNSSESPIYKKSNLLFGLHAARPAIQRKNRAILVEGNFDVIALHQAGFAETVAPLGTALTENQAETLRRHTERVILCMDGDKAGRAATLKDITLLVQAGIDTRVVALPQGEDPDSFVRKTGAEAFEKLVHAAPEAFEYYTFEQLNAGDRSTASLEHVLRTVAPIVAAERVENKRLMIAGQLARSLGMDIRRVESILRGRAEVLARPAAPSATAAPVVPPPPRELELLAILADHPSLLPFAEELGIGSLLTDARVRDMYSAAQAGGSIVDAAPPEISDIVAKVVFAGSYESVQDPRRTLTEAMRMLQRDAMDGELVELKRQIKDAERRGDTQLARELVLRQMKTRSMADQLGRRPEEDPR